MIFLICWLLILALFTLTYNTHANETITRPAKEGYVYGGYMFPSTEALTDSWCNYATLGLSPVGGTYKPLSKESFGHPVIAVTCQYINDDGEYVKYSDRSWQFRWSVRCETGFNLTTNDAGSNVCVYVSGGGDLATNGDQCDAVGNPIHIAWGDKMQTETDWIGGGALPLTLEHYYRSCHYLSTGGGFGAQWSHYYNRRLVIGNHSELNVTWTDHGNTIIPTRQTHSLPADKQDYLYLYRPNGKYHYHRKQGDHWITEAGTRTRFTPLANSSDWRGNVTTCTYNARGQETTRTEASGTPPPRSPHHYHRMAYRLSLTHTYHRTRTRDTHVLRRKRPFALSPSQIKEPLRCCHSIVTAIPCYFAARQWRYR